MLDYIPEKIQSQLRAEHVVRDLNQLGLYGGKGKNGTASSGKGGKKGGGKNASLGARLTKVENQTARMKSWHTMSCKGFGIRPCHAWKKDQMLAYISEELRNGGEGESEDSTSRP
eukprot:g5121.t1